MNCAFQNNGRTRGFKHSNGKVKISISLKKDTLDYINSLACEFMVSFNTAINYLLDGAVEVEKGMEGELMEFRLCGGIEKHRPAYLSKRNADPICEIEVKPDVFRMLTETEDQP